MKKAMKVVLGAVAGLAMLSVVVMSAWLVMRRGADDVATGAGNSAIEAEMKLVTLAELPDGEVDLERVRELYERPEVTSLQGIYEGEFGELEGEVDASRWLARRLERAEKEGDKVYLYERVLTVRCQPDSRFDEDGNQIGDGSSCGVLEVAATCGTPEFGWTGEMKGMTDEEVLNEATERGIGLLEWTFELDEAGQYVYRGMERDYGGEDDE